MFPAVRLFRHLVFSTGLTLSVVSCATDLPSTEATAATEEVLAPSNDFAQLRNSPSEFATVYFRTRAGTPVSRSQRLARLSALHLYDGLPGLPSAATVSRRDLARVTALPWLEILEVDSVSSTPVLLHNITPLAEHHMSRLFQEIIPAGVASIGAPLVHAQGNKGAGVIVAIIDDGVNCTHPDLAGRIIGGFDLVNYSANYCTGGAHGTPVAGIVAAEENGSYVLGVAPQAQLLIMKVCDNGVCPSSAIYGAYQLLTATTVHIATMSIGNCGGSIAGNIKYEMDRLLDQGVLLVAAAGNGASTGPPLNCTSSDPVSGFVTWDSRMIGVAAHNASTGLFKSGFQYGSAIDLSGPTDVETDGVGGGLYGSFGGTSAATPHVAGALGLVLASGIPANLAVARLQQTAVNPNTPGSHDNYYGWGRVRVDSAFVPAPRVNSLSWCFGSGAITVAGNCAFTATAANGINPPFLYQFEVTRSDQPGTTTYSWGSATRNILVPSGDYTLSVKVSVYEPSYGRTGYPLYQDIPVCTTGGSALMAPDDPSTNAVSGCIPGGGDNE